MQPFIVQMVTNPQCKQEKKNIFKRESETQAQQELSKIPECHWFVHTLTHICHTERIENKPFIVPQCIQR